MFLNIACFIVENTSNRPLIVTYYKERNLFSLYDYYTLLLKNGIFGWIWICSWTDKNNIIITVWISLIWNSWDQSGSNFGFFEGGIIRICVYKISWRWDPHLNMKFNYDSFTPQTHCPKIIWYNVLRAPAFGLQPNTSRQNSVSDFGFLD